MRITTPALTGAAAVAAILSGVLFAGIQFIHPSENLASVTTTHWAVVGALTLAMAVLGLVGVTGLYLRQVTQSGILGLCGYLLLAAFFLLTAMFTFAETFIFPVVAGEAPVFVTDAIGIASGVEPQGDVGALGVLGPVSGVRFTGGGVLFGLGLWRARLVPRWAAILLAAGALAPLLAAALPEAFLRFAALPVAAALVALGASLWRHRRADARDRSPAPRTVAVS